MRRKILAGVVIMQLCPLFGAPDLAQIAPGIYRYRDTCNVYAVVHAGTALLVDFGSGAIMGQLDKIGARRIAWVLHTHFHRDQCQGDGLARSAGAHIAVPEAERKYFETAEQLWQAKKVFHLYDLRNEFFALRENVQVDYGLKPDTNFQWEGFKIRVVATPGHTEGSLSFLLDQDGKTLAFCGDLVGSPGKIPTIHDIEGKNYVGANGILTEISSLNKMRQIAPALLLPSHGEPTADVQNTIPTLISHLDTIYDEYNWYAYTVRQPLTSPVQMTPHVWHVRKDNGTAYVIVSNSGHAFMWDCNAHDSEGVAEIRKRTGFRQIDFVALSHYHDDHVGGVNEIKRQYGAKVWAMRHMVDVLEHPMAYNLPCLLDVPTHVDRVLEDGEKIVWEGVPLQFFYLPGQTEYTEGLLLEIDGKRILFDGDNIAYPVPGRPMLGHYVCRNYQRLDGGHIYCAKKFLELRPDFIAPNHFEWVPARGAILKSYLDSAEQMKQAFSAIVDQPDPMFGVDNNWLSVYPYQIQANPGDTVNLDVRYRNWLNAESTVRGTFRGPEGWTFEPAVVELHAAPKSEARLPANVHIAPGARKDRRYVITLDTTRDGERLGEVTEALVNIAPMKAH